MVAGAGPDTGAEAPLEVTGLSVHYPVAGGSVAVLADVSFSVGPHERLMVIGPSGCGKSTLLRTVAGFHVPSAGTVTFDGRTSPAPGPDRAVVFQEFDQLFPWQTVIANVRQPLRRIGVGRAEAQARAEEQLASMGLSDVANRHPHQLSGGMKQRVAIARAVALRPRMLLMDEPFGSLDAITRTRLQRELRELSERIGVAVLFVTHSIEEALTVGDRILVLGRPPRQVRAVVDVPDPDDDGAVLASHRLLTDLLDEAGSGPGGKEGATAS